MESMGNGIIPLTVFLTIGFFCFSWALLFFMPGEVEPKKRKKEKKVLILLLSAFTIISFFFFLPFVF